ncbi:MAG: hypothetical protein WD934_09160 [Gemmatimonadales bacterium]
MRIAWCVLLLLPAAVGGQAPRPCDVELLYTGGEGRSIQVGPNMYRQFAAGGVRVRCRGTEIRMRADSVAYYPDFDRVDLVGAVRFEDSTAVLDARRASYFLSDERLDAHGDVALTNRRTGSVLNGPTLTYRRAASGVRDTAALDACGRPTAHYRTVTDTTIEPYVIIADCLWLTGDDAARARGTVTIDRSDFTGRGDSAALDGADDRGALIGHARVAGDSASYTLSGRRVDYRLQDNQLTWVRATERADATSEEWRIEADTIEFDVADDQVQAGRAWGDSARAAAYSALRTITADSLSILTPGQRLEAVRAYGTALAQTALDSLDNERDWVAGDTVVATFSVTNTMERLEAMGQGRTRYRIYEGSSAARVLRGINYSRGDRIIAHFAADVLHRVEVVGNADGVFLEAPGVRRNTP